MVDKKYAVKMENGKATSFEINGVAYTSLDQVSSPRDRRKLKAILAALKTDDGQDTPSKSVENPVFSMENIVLTAFTLIAVLMLAIAFISAGNAISTILRQKSAPGRVVDVVLRREYLNEQDRIVQEYYYPVVDFTADDGRRRTLQMNVGSSSPEYEKGDQVSVVYDPEHPLDAHVKSFGSAALMWILPSITGILGISFLVAVVAVRRVMFSND